MSGSSPESDGAAMSMAVTAVKAFARDIHQTGKFKRVLSVGIGGSALGPMFGRLEIAHGVGATVVAEGVETRDQWQFVSLMGCDIAQGYLIGRPVPAEELTIRLDVTTHIPLIAV